MSSVHRWFYAAVGSVALVFVAAAIAVVWVVVFPAVLAVELLKSAEDAPGPDRRPRPRGGRVDQAHSWRPAR